MRLDGALTPTGLLADAIVFARLQGTPGIATLYNCFASASRRGDGTVVSSKVDSTLVALGTLSEELGGQTVQFQLPGSPTWFNELNFKVDFAASPDVTVRFKSFESTHYPLNNDLSLERFFRAIIPLGGFGDEYFQTHRPMAFRIASTTRLDFDRLWELMYRLRRFFEFLSQHRMPHANLALYDRSSVDSGQPDIEIRHSSLHAVKEGKFDWDGQLIPFHNIDDRLPELLQKWFFVHEAFPESFNRYFSAFDRDKEDAILHFLWNVAALEELHKLRTTRISGKDFSLLDRLKDIRARWSSAFSQPPNDEVLIHIKDSRHYYAHAAGDLRDKAAKDWALLRYGDFLAALANLEILAMLGLTDEDVLGLTNQYWMRETLALQRYPDD